MYYWRALEQCYIALQAGYVMSYHVVFWYLYGTDWWILTLSFPLSPSPSPSHHLVLMSVSYWTALSKYQWIHTNQQVTMVISWLICWLILWPPTTAQLRADIISQCYSDPDQVLVGIKEFIGVTDTFSDGTLVSVCVWVGGWVSEWVCVWVCVCGWVSEWVSVCVCACVCVTVYGLFSCRGNTER